MNSALVISVSVVYLALLFGIAYITEQRKRSGKSVVHNSWVYALSLAVYCTGWTYYGSVGRAATIGAEFLTIYLGPSILCALFVPVLLRIVRISKTQRISSIADFISTRYGKNFTLGIVVTLCCVLGVIPYIALQLKAISTSYHVISGIAMRSDIPLWQDDSLYIAIAMATFIVLYGTRSADASERHEGLVAAIAFESIIKLAVFIAVGVFITWYMFHGFGDLFSRAADAGMNQFFVMDGQGAYASWTTMILVSMMAMILLPRQFQVAVVENTDERHLRRAMWLFPLYLVLINLFVVPIAIAGKLVLPGATDADTYVLSLPLHTGNNWLGMFVYIGGLSAASSMIIVETIALATMVSNHLVLPAFLTRLHRRADDRPATRRILFSRRASIVVILLLAFLYDRYIAPSFPLVSIGVVSMVAVAQFAPAFIAALYWRRATKSGAVAGIISGFIVWAYTLIVPAMADAGYVSSDLLTQGPWGISWLSPHTLFGLSEFDPVAHAFFWSMTVNAAMLILFSTYSEPGPEEIFQANLFCSLTDEEEEDERRSVWKGTAYYADIRRLLSDFLGEDRSLKLLASYEQRHQLDAGAREADPRVVSFAEKILSGVVGSASARFMISNITKEEQINIDEVMNIVRESQQVLELNKELRKKSIELTRATTLLRQVNEQLTQADVLKDEFLYTVTHELRTPLTSIRAMSEIIYDNPDMDEEMRQKYLGNIVSEIERLSYLITQVLNLERYESGRQKLHMQSVDVAQLVREVIPALQPLADTKAAAITLSPPSSRPLVQCDKDLVRQVVYNLVSNALKYLPSADGFVKLSVHIENGEVQIWVEDNGKGVPDELQKLIFDKFFQAHNQTLKKPEGSGLGLAISKRIVEMHSGRIWVENRAPAGARFIFTLPYDV